MAELLKQANRGDRSVLPEMRRLLDDSPELWQFLGDLGRHAKSAWINRASGEDLVRRETLMRSVAALEEELAGPNPSAIERVLAERVVVTWLEVHTLDPVLTERTEMTLAQAAFYDKRRVRAHRRLLAAIRTLATVRRLVVPTLQVSGRPADRPNRTTAFHALAGPVARPAPRTGRPARRTPPLLRRRRPPLEGQLLEPGPGGRDVEVPPRVGGDVVA